MDATPQSRAPSPTIQTERLILRAWKEEDLPPFAAMNADPRVREFFPNVLTAAQSDDEARCFQRRYHQEGFCLFAAELRTESTFIGFVGMQTMNFQVPLLRQPIVEIGWRLAFPFWGRGLATEGARAVVEHAFDVVHLQQIAAIAVPSNFRSRKIIQKIGMRHIPKLGFDHPHVPEGHPLKPHVLYQLNKQEYDILRKEWSRRKSGSSVDEIASSSLLPAHGERAQSFRERNDTVEATERPTIALPRTRRAPYLARFSRDVGGDRWSPLLNLEEYQSECSGIPHLAKNERDTRISCTQRQSVAACAAFIKESRMKSVAHPRFTGNPGIRGFPVRSASQCRVCGFHQGKPHEVSCPIRPSQEIRVRPVTRQLDQFCPSLGTIQLGGPAVILRRAILTQIGRGWVLNPFWPCTGRGSLRERVTASLASRVLVSAWAATLPSTRTISCLAANPRPCGAGLQ
jgi:RimJ/RimL family protein N-acetyltransferase